jgi:uncharacterized protein (DUF2147 family)
MKILASFSISFLLLSAGAGAGAGAAAAASASIQGLWLTDDRKAVIQIAPCGRQMCGTIAKVLDKSPQALDHDAHNPDPKLRGRKIVGLPTLTGFDGAGGSWKGGRAYDPKSGKSYRSAMELQPDGRLKVSGCIMFLCDSMLWTRVR